MQSYTDPLRSMLGSIKHNAAKGAVSAMKAAKANYEKVQTRLNQDDQWAEDDVDQMMEVDVGGGTSFNDVDEDSSAGLMQDPLRNPALFSLPPKK